MFIYNAKIYPVDAPVIENGYVEVERGVIVRTGSGAPENKTIEDIDAKGALLLPGFIDAHSHIGLIGDGMGEDGDDANEDSDPVTPHLRAIDALNFTDGYFKDAYRAGITAVVTGPGSSNPIAGDFIAIKTCGRSADEMLIRQAGIKFALGENPKVSFSGKESPPVTRMATAALIREALYKAKRYAEDSESGETPPEYDIKCEALIPLIRGEIKACFHCHRADDIMTAVRIAKEFSLKLTLIHCTEGYLIGDLIKEAEAEAVIGPVICDRGKPELSKLSAKNAPELYKRGIKFAICSDHPETPSEYLSLSAALCVKNGLPAEEAIKAITLTAAEICGIDDKTGSITAGKDADLILLDGDPFDIMTNVVMTMINGKVIYERN